MHQASFPAQPINYEHSTVMVFYASQCVEQLSSDFFQNSGSK